MLVDRLKTLLASVRDIGEVDRLKGDADKFKALAGEFRALADELSVLCSAVTLMAEQAIPVPDQIAPGAARHRAVYREVGLRYEIDRGSVLTESRTARQNLKQWVAQQNGEVRQAWADHVSAAEPEISDELLRIFHKIPSFAHTVIKIRKLQEELAKLKRALPKSWADFHHATVLVQQLCDTALSLDGESIPPRVLHFLRRIAAGDARLELVDADVLGWLCDRGLLREFQVRPASGP
jgi:hypothetical protein